MGKGDFVRYDENGRKLSKRVENTVGKGEITHNDENGRKLSKRVENTVGKGEIARYEQFLLFPRCFLKACFPGASKGVIAWEWVKRDENTMAGSKKFQNSHSSACHSALILQLDKVG